MVQALIHSTETGVAAEFSGQHFQVCWDICWIYLLIACLILFLYPMVLDNSKLIPVALFNENVLMELIFHFIDHNELFHQTVHMTPLEEKW